MAQQQQAQLTPAPKKLPLQPLGLAVGGAAGSPQPPFLLDPQGSLYGRRPDDKASARGGAAAPSPSQQQQQQQQQLQQLQMLQ
jgi:hypothetical protein